MKRPTDQEIAIAAPCEADVIIPLKTNQKKVLLLLTEPLLPFGASHLSLLLWTAPCPRKLPGASLSSQDPVYRLDFLVP